MTRLFRRIRPSGRRALPLRVVVANSLVLRLALLVLVITSTVVLDAASG